MKTLVALGVLGLILLVLGLVQLLFGG